MTNDETPQRSPRRRAERCARPWRRRRSYALSRRAFDRGRKPAYPSRPVRFVLPFGAGGVADVTSRLTAEKLGDKLGQRFVVENQPGAGGINAVRTVLGAAPDGYTLGLVTNGTAISAASSRRCRSIR